MAGGQYTIRLHGVLDETRIRQQIAAIQKEMGTMAIGGKGKGKGGGAYFANAGKEAKKGTKGMSAYVKGTEQATKSTKRFGQSTIDITKKVIQFGATTAVIRGVTSGMADMVNKTFELDGALTEFKKVSDLSGKGLEKYTEQAFKAGRSVAKTGTEMIQASTEFRKSGFNDQDSMKLGKVAMMFSNIADAELSASDAAGFITSQIRADYKDISTEADKASMQIIDAINEVSNTQAVSSTDLSMAMSKVGSALQVNNNNYAESLGMVVAGTERMHGQASKVGRGIRTIGANISKLQKESKTLDLQTKDGVKTIDLWDKKTGQVKSTYEVFKEFAGVWDDMTPDQQQALSLEMAGKNQQEVFASVVGNWKNAEKAAKTATDQIENGGSAIEENAKYVDSMAGHLEDLKSAWSEFSNSMVKSEGLKKGMGTLADFLRFLSSDAGHNLLGIAAGLTATYVAAKPLVGLFSKGKAIKDFMVFAGAFGKTEKKLKSGANTFSGTAKRFTKMSDNFVVQSGRTTKATKGLKQAAGAATGAMNPLGLAVAAVGAAMAVNAVGIYKAYKETHKYREAADELTVSNQKSVKSIEDNAKHAEFLTETLDRLNGIEHKTQGQKELLKQTVKELNELYPELNLKYDEEKDKVNKTTDAIRDYIKAMQEEAKAAAYKSNLEKSVKQQLKLEEKRKKAIDNLAEAQKQYDKEVQSGYVSQATSQRLAKAKTEFKDLQDAYIQTTKEVTKQSNNVVKSSGAWDKLVKKAKKAGTDIPKSVKKGIEDGTYTIPESMKQLESLISLDKLSQQVKQTPIGKDLVESLEQGLRESKLDIGQALDIESEMNKMGGKMDAEAKKSVQNLVDSFNSGQIDFDQFEKGMNKISDDMSAIDKKKLQPKVDIKGGEKAEKEIGKVTDDLKTAGKTKAKPEIKVKGGGKAKDETTKVEESMDELDGKDADVQVNETGATEATGEVHGLMDVISALFGKNVPVTQTGASEATGQVGGLESEIAGLSGNTVDVQEQGASASAGRVGALNSIIGKLQSRTVQETAKTSGAGGVASLVGYQNSLYSKTVTYTVKTHKVNEAHGTKHAPNSLAQVNEYGYEYIRDAKTGALRVANKGRRGLTMLNEGDIVYTHGESMRMRQAKEEEIPKYAKGKKLSSKQKRNLKKAKNSYKKHVERIRDRYDARIDDLEHQQEMEHRSDSWMGTQMQKAWDKYTKKLKKYNKSKAVRTWLKKWKKNGFKLTQGLGKQRRYEKDETKEDARYDVQANKLEDEIENLGFGLEDRYLDKEEVQAEEDKLKKLRDKHKLSAEDYDEYMDTIYHNYVESQMKMYEAGEKTADDMKAILKEQAESGKITWNEYYDYIDQIAEDEKDKEEERLEKLKEDKEKAIEDEIDNYHLRNESIDASIAKVKQLAKEGQLTTDEELSYIKELKQKHLDQFSNMYSQGSKTYAEMRALIEKYYKDNTLTAEEYYDKLDELASNQLSKEQDRLSKRQEQANNENSLARAWIQRKISDLEKQNEEQEEQNELIEKQMDLEKAKARRVRVYREGVGFVYEKDTEAIKEATKALQDYKKQQEDPKITELKNILAMFDEAGERADIKNLENLTGLSANAYFGKFGTNQSTWANWLQGNLSTSNGIGLLLNELGNMENPNKILELLGASGHISESMVNQYINKSRYASGALRTKAGFARVDEQGYEIALFGAGDSVIPHNLSKNLMEWGQMSPLEYAQSGGVGGDMYNYSFDKLVLPNVSNADDFMRELKNLPNRALQFSGGRA